MAPGPAASGRATEITVVFAPGVRVSYTTPSVIRAIAQAKKRPQFAGVFVGGCCQSERAVKQHADTNGAVVEFAVIGIAVALHRVGEGHAIGQRAFTRMLA